MRTGGTPEGTPARAHDAKAWLAIATPDPAFFLVGVDDGEPRQQARPEPRREAGREGRTVAAGED